MAEPDLGSLSDTLGILARHLFEEGAKKDAYKVARTAEKYHKAFLRTEPRDKRWRETLLSMNERSILLSRPDVPWHDRVSGLCDLAQRLLELKFQTGAGGAYCAALDVLFLNEPCAERVLQFDHDHKEILEKASAWSRIESKAKIGHVMITTGTRQGLAEGKKLMEEAGERAAGYGISILDI